MSIARTILLAINSRAAATALSADELDVRDVAILVLIGQMFLAGVGYVSLYFGATFGLPFLVEAVLATAISGWGVWHCYQKNGGESGKRFAEKFLVLSTPIGWKIALFGWLVLLLLSYSLGFLTIQIFAMEFSDEQFDAMLSWVDAGWNLAMVFLFFLRLGHWIDPSRCARFLALADDRST